MPTLDEEILAELRAYDASKNSLPTRQIAPAPSQSDDEILRELAEYDQAKSRIVTPLDQGPGWFSDKVRRVGQGAAEGSISAIEGLLNFSAQEVNKPFPMARFTAPGMDIFNILARPRQDSGLVDRLNEAASVARELKKDQREVYGANPKYDRDFGAMVAQGVGSSAPGITAALASSGATLPAYAITALQLYQENFDSAIEANQSPDVAHKSGMMAMPLSIFEKFGDVRIGKLLRESVDNVYRNGRQAIGKIIGKVAGSAVGEGATEGAQEAGKQVIENEILKYKDQTPGERVVLTGISALVGSAAGTIMGTPGAAIDLVGNLLKEDEAVSPIPTPENLRAVRGKRRLSAIEPLTTKEKNAKQDSRAEEQQTGSSNVEQVQETAIQRQVPSEAQEPVVTDVPSPPPSVTAIAKRAGKDVIPMTGPDSKVHWFTFDGFQERTDGSYVPQLTPVGPEPAPGLSKGSSYLMPKLIGYAPIGQLPWRERLQLPPAAETIPQNTETITPVPETPAPVPETPVVPAEIPKLRSMENQGDLLSNQTEDFALAGERGIDFERREQERVAAETRAREAAEIQAKQQLGLPLPETPPAAPTATVKRPKATLVDERPPDIIDAIQELIMPTFSSVKGSTQRPAGKGIQSKKYANDISEYNESYDILWKLHSSNPARKLFAIGKGGTPIDELRDMLRSAGAIPENATGADVFDMMLDALDVRKNFQGQNQKFERTANQGEQFQNVAIDNKRPKEGDRLRAVKIPASYLEKGDTFKLDGELVKVGGIDSESGGIIVTNGERFGQQVLKGNEVIYADYRTFKKADPAKQKQPIPEPSDNYEPTIVPETVTTDDRPFSIVPPSGRASKGTTASAQGIPAIREMIKSSNLPANTKRVFDDFLSQPVMQRPEFSDLVVALRDKILIGGRTAGGVAEVDTNFIELSESDANSETLGHELAHFFFEMLPKDVQAKIDGWRVEEIKSRHGEDASALLLSGRMTSEQAAEMGLPIEDYHLINASEFLAHMVSTKFAEDSFAGRNDPEKQSLIDKIKAWLRELWNSIKRVLKVAPSKQQIYEDILAGRIVNTPRSGTAYEKRASFVRNPAEARNAEELVQNAREQKIEGQHQVAQSADIVKVLEKHGVTLTSPKSMEILNYPDHVGINVVGERMLGATGETYQTIKPTLNPYEQKWIARIAATKFNLFRRDLREAIKARDELVPKVTSPSFLNLLMKEAAAKSRTDTADTNTKLMNAVLDSALKKAERALRYEDRSERAIDEIKGQIREMNEARNSSVALHQLVDDMVVVLASTPDGVQMLLDPKFGTRSDIVKMYRDLKISTGQTLHNPTLLKWGAYILQRNKRLRENLVAAHMAKESPLRAAMTKFEGELTDLLKKSPAKAIREIGKGTARMATERERAKFAWRTLNKKVMERLNEFTVANDAAEVAEKVLADPDFKNLTAEINNDAGWIGEQKPYEMYFDKILLPSGTEIDVGAKYFDGSKAIFDRNRARIESAITELKSFLHANPDDLNYGTHVRNLETLENYFTGLGLLQPNDSIKVWSATFGILHNVADNIGGRTGVVLRKSIRKYDEAHTISTNWMQKHSFHLTASRAAAMTSHGMKWGELGARSLPEMNQIYWDKVGNVLAYSHNRQQEGFKVGDMLPSGEKVTKEDMDHLRMMSSAGEELYKALAKEGYVVDNLGGFDFFRQALKGTPMMTTRKADNTKLGIGRQISAALQAYRTAAPADQDAALEALVDVLDNYWKVIGQSLVFDRNPDFARATEYDGPGGALQVMANDARLYPDARSFFDEVANLSGNPVEEVTKTLALEWARPISDWYSYFKPDAKLVPRSEEQANSFTQSRNLAMAPYAFYENGFKNSSSLMQFGSGAQSRGLDELTKGFEVAVEDIQRQMDEFEAKVQNLRAAGVTNPEEVAKSRQALARENGRNYDNYQDLQKRMDEAVRMRDILSNREPVNANSVAGRYIGFVTGSLIGTFTTLRNVTEGPRYIGQVGNRLMGAAMVSYPAAFWYGFIRAQLPFIGSAALSLAKSAAYTIPIKGPIVAMYRLFSQPRGGISKVAADFMEPFMKELGENIYNRVKIYREMMDRGIVPKMNAADAEINARLMGSLLSGGQLMEKDMTRLQKALLIPISLGELLFLNFSQKVNPKFGDAALNSGMYMFMRSSAGPLRYHESRWKEIASLIKSGARAWDATNPDNPINRLTYQEIFPRGIRLASSEADLTYARDVYAKAGSDYDKIAGRAINDLLNGGAGRHTVQEENALAETTINLSNRASAGNTPQFAKSKGIIARWLNPFWSWATRMFSNFINLLSVPVRTGKSPTNEQQLRRARMGQFAYMLTMIILPLLVFGALFGIVSNEELRAGKKLIFDQVMAYRQPWEREGGQSQAIGWTVEMLNNIPILGGIMSMAINDIPVRATMDPNFVMLEKIKDATKYIGGVVQTGDFGYKLPEFVMGMVPDSRIVLGRSEFFAGRQEANNAAALLRRYGPMDDMRTTGGKGGGQTANELSPYGDRMINAAMEGKTDELQSIYAEAVEVARKLGKANPERVVTEIYRSRNPYDRVFKRKITEDERQKILNAASPSERAILEEAERKFAAGAALIGSSSNFTSEQASASRSSRGGAIAGMGASAGVGAVMGIPRSRTGRTRRTRISTGRRGRRRGSLRTRARRPRRLRQPRGLRAGRRRQRGALRGLV